MVDGYISSAGAKDKTIQEENLLEVAKDLRLGKKDSAFSRPVTIKVEPCQNEIDLICQPKPS